MLVWLQMRIKEIKKRLYNLILLELKVSELASLMILEFSNKFSELKIFTWCVVIRVQLFAAEKLWLVVLSSIIITKFTPLRGF